MTIHWCGTDPLALPGLRGLLADAVAPVVVWSDRTGAALELAVTPPERIERFDPDRLGLDVQAGDVIVSVMGAAAQPALAKLAVNKGAHVLSPGALLPGLAALEGRALLARVAMIAELGVSPGIDTLMMRHLVAAWQASPAFDPGLALDLRIAAGSLPAEPGPLRAETGTEAQALWSALSAPARAIRDFREERTNLAWDAAEPVTLLLAEAERFELLPRGDAVALLDLCGVDPTWPVRAVSRGLIRPRGWQAAWGPVLSQIEALNTRRPPAAAATGPEATLRATGGHRVVLYAELRAERAGTVVWHQTAALDAVDTARGPALARLLGRHLRLAIAATLAGEATPGAHSGWPGAAAVQDWLRALAREARHFEVAHR